MMARAHIDDEARRARLVARHHLGRTASDPAEAVTGVVAMHSSDPLTPHLGTWARVPGFATGHLDRALYETRGLWRLHAMRRTLFVVTTDDWPVFEAAAARSIARRERRRVEGWLEAEMPGDDVAGWLAGVESATLVALESHDAELTTRELNELVPPLATEITLGSGKWAGRSRLSSRLLFLLAMEGRVVRATPAGTWRSSQYRWAPASRWFGRELDATDPATGRAELARRYLRAFGPATDTDVRWWAGWTAKQAREALTAVDAVTVDLEDGGEGFVLPDDVEPDVQVPGPQVALLPGLDPTPMGWKERHWYLPAHGDALFDGNGNVGPTVWVDGRVVGGWGQRADGEVVHRLLEDVGREAAEVVATEAAALTEWLDGVVVTPRFRTPLERELTG